MKNTDPIIERAIKVRNEQGPYVLGIHRNTEYHEKPQKLLFTLSRYKFVAKMLEGKNLVAEVGGGTASAQTFWRIQLTPCM